MSTASAVSVCICTRNRPEELARCLQSLHASTHPVAQTIVSDDSTDSRTLEMVRASYPWVRFVEGPRKGLGANRNRALAEASGDYVLFIDDDACLGPTFLQQCLGLLAKQPSGGRRVIVSGREDNRGTLVKAHNQSFLGFQNVPYGQGDRLVTIVINATLFPRSLFREIRFDEQLVYGYDEVDVALKAVGRGYTILQCDEAINSHYPSSVNRAYYRAHTEASRLYVTLKRYASYEKKPLKATAYALCGAAHCTAAAIRQRGPAGLLDAWRTVRTARSYWSKRPRGAALG
jgi:GT2 family glycosyltransferase